MDSETDSTTEELPETEVDLAAGVGDRLRLTREAKRLELSHIAGETRIPIRHLEVIEAGRFEELPSRTYAVGFARSYARALGLEEEDIANAVREELADGQARASAMAGGMEPGDPAKLPSAGLAWFGAFAAILFAVGVIFFYNTYFAAGSGPAPLIAANDGSEDASEATDAEESASASANVAAAPDSSGQVVFTALEDGVWVRFYEDGGDRLFEDIMESGERFELPADASEPRINTGRPDAFSITIGGQSVPKLAEEPVTMGDTPVSAAALLARADAAPGVAQATN